MKLKSNYALRQVADTWIVLSLGEESVDFNGMLSLNEAGVLLWKALEKGGSREDLADALMQEYIVDSVRALTDVDEFLDKLRQFGCLEL